MNGKLARPTTLIAVRHGETEWNRAGRLQGHQDRPLTELGRQQALAMAEALSGWPVRFIYASDLGRARATAGIIAQRLNLEVRTDPRLRERNFGIMEGLTIPEFQARHPREASAYGSGNPDFVVPGGESIRQKFARNIGCGDEIASRHTGDTVLVVAHGGVLTSFFHKAAQLPLETRRTFSLFNGAINVFTVADSVWRLDTWGSIAHLRSVATADLNDG